MLKFHGLSLGYVQKGLPRLGGGGWSCKSGQIWTAGGVSKLGRPLLSASFTATFKIVGIFKKNN